MRPIPASARPCRWPSQLRPLAVRHGGVHAGLPSRQANDRKARFVLGGVMFVLGLGAAIFSVAGGPNGIAHAILMNLIRTPGVTRARFGATVPDGPYVSIETPNSPIASRQGIHPGRWPWSTTRAAATNGTITWDNTTDFTGIKDIATAAHAHGNEGKMDTGCNCPKRCVT